MRRKKPEIIDLPFDERMEMATHYKRYNIQPNHRVELGFINEYNSFETLYISLHKQDAKRRNLIEYKI